MYEASYRISRSKSKYVAKTKNTCLKMLSLDITFFLALIVTFRQEQTKKQLKQTNNDKECLHNIKMIPQKGIQYHTIVKEYKSTFRAKTKIPKNSSFY